MVKTSSEKALPNMKLERTSPVKSRDQLQFCAELVSGANDKRPTVKEDEVMPEKVSPLATRPSFEGGMGSRGMNASINGNASGVGGPFTSSQLNELQQQIFIFRCIEAKIPMPYELLISFGKRPGPPIWPSAFSSGLPRPRTLTGTCTPRSQYQRSSKKGCTNFCWSPAMTCFLLPFLVQQANFRLKMGRAFKREAFITAAEAVTEKFELRCNDVNVENHLRTIKTRYLQIRRLKSMNNTVWDEKEKKIIMNDKDYVQYIAANPRDEPFLNKPIEMYDEVVFICGDDPAHESIANEYIKESNDGHLIPPQDNEEDLILKDNEDGHEIAVGDEVDILMDTDNLEIEEVREVTPPTPPPPPSSRSPHGSASSGSSGRTGQSGKQRKSDNLGDRIHFLASQIGELAAAITSSHSGISFELYSEVMKCEGYDEASLGKAFVIILTRMRIAQGVSL